MKTLIAVLFAALSINQGIACSPPPDTLGFQQGPLGLITTGDKVYAKIRSLGGKDLKSLTYEAGTYTIASSNGCSFKVRPVYEKPSHPGMCPRLVDLSITDVNCLEE